MSHVDEWAEEAEKAEDEEGDESDEGDEMAVETEAGKKDEEKTDTAEKDVRNNCDWNENLKLYIFCVSFAQNVLEEHRIKGVIGCSAMPHVLP